MSWYFLKQKLEELERKKGMKKVYIAGKLSGKEIDYIDNMRDMIKTANMVREAGYAVYVPCLDFMMGLVCGDWKYEDYFNNNFSFISSCNYMFVCDGSENSKGTQREIACAKELGMEVFWNLATLLAWDKKF